MTFEVEPALDVRSEHRGDQHVLVLSGELDPHTAPRLQEAFEALFGPGDELAAGADVVVLDLAGVSFIDSSGLRVLIGAHKHLDAAGGRLVLLQPTEAVHRLLEITGLVERFEVER